MGLLGRLFEWILPSTGKKIEAAEPDEQLRSLRAERRSRRYETGVIDDRGDAQVANRLFQLGRSEEALQEVERELASVPRLVDMQFEGCTPAEKRGMRAMKRHELYGQLATLAATPEQALASRVAAYIWWLCGLKVQGRGKEAHIAHGSERWVSNCSGLEARPDVLAWLLEQEIPGAEDAAELLAKQALLRIKKPAP